MTVGELKKMLHEIGANDSSIVTVPDVKYNRGSYAPRIEANVLLFSKGLIRKAGAKDKYTEEEFVCIGDRYSPNLLLESVDKAMKYIADDLVV